MHFSSRNAAKQAVENIKMVRDDLDVKSEEETAYASMYFVQSAWYCNRSLNFIHAMLLYWFWYSDDLKTIFFLSTDKVMEQWVRDEKGQSKLYNDYWFRFM